MENKKLATLQISNHRLFIPAVLSFIDMIITQHKNYDIDRCNQLRFVVTKMLLNRITNAYPNTVGELFVELSIVDDYLEISVRDKGVPQWIDFSYDEQLISSDTENFQKFVLDKCIDCVGLEKLGKDGQRLYVRQKIRNPISFETPKPYELTKPLDTNITIKAVETEEDAIEAIRCIYSEYGYSYAYEKLYYVDNLMRMIREGELMSFLAVNEHGQTAGHFALAFSDLFDNMPEISTVVTRKEFRGLGLFAKFMDHAEKIAKEKGFRAMMGQPVAYHPISQKAFLKSNYTATSILLSYIGSEVESEYNKQKERLDLFACIKMMDENATTVIYPPAEIKSFVAKICEKATLKAEAKDDKELALNTCVKIEDNVMLKMKRIILTQAGEDVEKILKDAVADSIRKKHEMLELFISLRHSSCEEAFITAKKCKFTLSGILPGAENDDYIVMQLLIKSVRSYDQLVTVGEFEELTQDIKALTEKREK
ncbi:MAG: GNAT family N-acetyltransferase [Ruminococcus sp.]|nr:GNAT family N-acetyltransferase [Ruminococcus sp.]